MKLTDEQLRMVLKWYQVASAAGGVSVGVKDAQLARAIEDFKRDQHRGFL